MYKKCIVAALLGTLLLGNSGCRKYLDINDSPNAATMVDPSLLFNYAATTLASTRAGGDEYLSLALAAQTIASGGFYGWGTSNVYDISIYSLGNAWKMYYSTAGNNLVQAIRLAESSEPRNDNAAAVSKILLAECLYEATILWGDVPYSEAWNNEIPYPHFDPQQKVLNGVVDILDSAIAQIDLSAGVPKISSGDLFYTGNLGNWRRAANGLKLRALFAMVDRDPTKAAEIGRLVTSGNLLTSASQNLQFPFYTLSNTENPKFRLLKRYAGGSNIFFFANNTVLQPMQAQSDPRIPRYFDKHASIFYGVNTEAEADDSTATISSYLYRADAPELIFSYQEQLFFIAEAYARGLGVPMDLGTANTYYQQALKEACLYYGTSVADAASFSTSKNLTSVSDPVAEIHLQQWIDLMDRPIEAFTNWRRSGPIGHEVPALTLPKGAPNGPLIRRLTYPLAEEITPNPNAPKTLPLYYDPEWFDL
jgi:hypothetical protein